MKPTQLAIRIFTVIAIVGSFFTLSYAQNREKHVISAKAGGVNAVAGRVMVKRSGQAAQLLSNQDDLTSGDVVTTGMNSQVEILLNPGSYLRLAENSEFTLVDNSLNNLLVSLGRGSAIIEATGNDYTELRIGIAIGQEMLFIVRRGIYRLIATPTSTEVLVRKGRVQIGNDPKQIVKSGRKLTFAGGTSFTAKLEKSEPDEFDKWSKERGKTLARANEKLSARLLNGYLSRNTFSLASGFGRGGLWTFSPFLRCFTFLPFYADWSSPYGGYYGNLWPYYDYFNRGCCGNRQWGITTTPTIVTNSGSGGGSWPNSSGGSGGSSGSGGSGGFPPPSSGPSRGPVNPFPTQAGPRDPDSGGRRVPKIDQ